MTSDCQFMSKKTMTEPDLWMALATLRELNKETSSLIEIESQSQKIDKLEKVRNGLEDLVARLDRLGGAETGIADEIGSRDIVEDAIRNDLFEDIPKRLAKPLVNQLKGWSFHVENPDKFHLIHVKFSSQDHSSFCEKSVSLERYPDDKNKVLLKILEFDGEPRISDRIFCRIDGLIEALLSRLTAVPIKCEPLISDNEPWSSIPESITPSVNSAHNQHHDQSPDDRVQQRRDESSDFRASLFVSHPPSPRNNSDNDAASTEHSSGAAHSFRVDEFLSRDFLQKTADSQPSSRTTVLAIEDPLNPPQTYAISAAEEKVGDNVRPKRARTANVVASLMENDDDDMDDTEDMTILSESDGEDDADVDKALSTTATVSSKSVIVKTSSKRRVKAESSAGKRKAGRPKKRSVEVKKSGSDEDADFPDQDDEAENSQDELEGAVIEEMLMTSEECRLCQCVVPHADVNAHMFAMHKMNDPDSKPAFVKNDDNGDKDRLQLSLPSATTFQCAFCEHVAFDLDGVDSHVQEKHSPPDPVLYCESCALGFYTDVGLEAHRMKEHNCRTKSTRNQICDLCGRAFAFAQTLRKHKICRHGDGSSMAEKEKRKRKSLEGKRGLSKSLSKMPSFQPCRVCEKQIEFRDSFLHMESIHGLVDACPFCPGTHRKLRNHISRFHNPKPALYCEVCGACFRTHSSLKGHRLNQHFKDQKRHVCEICSTSFAFAYMLNNHKRALHEGIKTSELPKNFVCDVCNRAFRTHELRRRHRLRVHTPELGEYVCNDCGKIMTDRQGFNNHILIHSEDRNFVCDICSKAFRTNKNLHQHKLSHLPPRHACPFCPKKFIYACGLRAHKKQVHENSTGILALSGVVGSDVTAVNMEKTGGVAVNNDASGVIVSVGSIGGDITGDAGHSPLFSGAGIGVLTSTSSIGRQSDPTIGAIGVPASVLTSSSTLHHAMTSAMTTSSLHHAMTSVVVPSGVITHNDLQKVMNSQELDKVMNPGELTLGHHLHNLHNQHSQLHNNLNSGNPTLASKFVDANGVGLPNHAATLSKLASGDLATTMGKMNPNDLGSLCKMSPLELTYLG